jgi:hypothetical protein
MANNIIGEPFRDYVAQQINIRQKYHGSGTSTEYRTAEELAYLNSKTAWIKLASGISITEERLRKDGLGANQTRYHDAELAKNFILFGGTSRLEPKNSNDNPSNYPILKQRGTYNGVNNIWDWYKGTYNVNGNLTNNDSTGEFGLVPPPGIVSADIKCLNRGSIKKATVNLKCYSPEQFRILDDLYLRIGYTMLLEWGWAPYVDNKGEYTPNYYTIIEDPDGWFSDKAKSSDYILNKIQGYRAAKDGNYDALLCKVVNFSWTFAQDGSYDITLSLISIGDVIESLKTNVAPTKAMSNYLNDQFSLYNENRGEDENITPSPTNNIISAYLFLQTLYLDPTNNPESTVTDLTDSAASTLSSEINGSRLDIGGWFVIPPTGGIGSLNPVYNEYGKKSGDGYDLYEPGVNQWLLDNRYNGYVKVDDNFQLMASRVNSYFYVQILGNWKVRIKTFPDPTASTYKQKKKDVCYINYNSETFDNEDINNDGFYMRFGHLLAFIQDHVIPVIEDTEEPILTIDYSQWENVMYRFPYQVSFDPRVCIVSGDPELIGDTGANQKMFWGQLWDWKDTYDKGYAHVMNIYVSHRQILASLNDNLDDDGNLALFDFIQSICTALNKALGGVNNLEVVLDEEENTLRIIDSSYNSKLNNNAYGLELFGYNPKFNSSNFVRKFDLKTEITNDFATMATVGSTAGGYVKGTENTMFSKWNKGLKDRFKETLTTPNKESRIKTGSIAEANEEYTKNFWQAGASAFGVTEKNVEDYTPNNEGYALNDEIIDKNVAYATEFYKYCQYEIRENYNDKYASPRTGFVPISLGVTMDGLAGIKIYNAVNVDTRFLPVNYPESLKFIIKGVNHKLQNNDWETSIETVVIYQNEDYN